MARRSSRKRAVSEINMVPFIDVMLVLLIIFMVAAPLIQQGIEIDLPKASADPVEPDPKGVRVVLSIDREGRMFLDVGSDAVDPRAPLSEPELFNTAAAAIGLAQQGNRPLSVLVKADRSVDYGRVVKGMVLLKQAGAPKVGLSTDPGEG